MRHLFFAAILAASFPAFAGDIQVAGTTTVAPGDMAILTVTSEGATGFYWTAVGHNRAVFDPLQNGSSIAFSAGSSGEYRWVVSVREGEIATPSLVTITVGKRPEPTPDVDPVPDDDDPPVPVPDVEPILPGDGFRVMILYESGDRLPAGQAAIITSARLRDYIESKGGKDSYRIWDDDLTEANLRGQSTEWRTGFANAKKAAESAPWLVATNGSKQVSVALPHDVDTTLQVLQGIE